MSSAYLEAYIDNATSYIERGVSALIQGSLSWTGAQQLCAAFRQRAVCTLLLLGQVRRFQQDLMRSGGAFLYYLPRAPEDEKITSQAKPLLDAIGAGAWGCASRIAAHSRMAWNADREYQEDFLYIEFLMQHFFLGASPAESEATLARCEAALQGADRTRLDICLAFVKGDEGLLDSSLRALLDRRADNVEGAIARGALPEEVWSWLRYFSSEGLALLRLADEKGFRLSGTYQHVPEVARRAAPLPFDPDVWRALG
ncbi:hypothetical protein WME90_26205 [Sorangium sp. So ce375]|uniref:hypothetical protein n=1 Tax=Sorangium sp. So ce375 TaxID=3133306 RepID=UPI003F5BDD0B